MAHRGWSVALLFLLVQPAWGAWQPTGVDLSRPRILFRSEDLPEVRARMEREAYQPLVDGLVARIRQADAVALDDDDKGAHRIKARAAKNLAFLYALGWTADGNVARPFAGAEERRAAGERICTLLQNVYPRSRLAVPPPLGGWDRDISSSEELLMYATAYDTALGAGLDCGEEARRRLIDLASELYENYVQPASAFNFSLLHQNNHRSKTGASLVMAGVALAEHTPDPENDPEGYHEPANWIDYGLDQVDLIMRWALVTGDGAYGEGPFYFRFASENLLPFARAWERLLGGAEWEAHGLSFPSLWSHPLFARSQRWVLDMTLPDGSLAPFDDGNPGRFYFFGALDPDSPLAPAFAWRWQEARQPFESAGNVDLAADSIVTFDDTIVPAPPDASPTAFYIEGGNAVLRSDWSSNAVVALIQGEHDTASEFGRDRSGRGVAPESHEHAEPGAFMLYAFGERLALDPGYLSFDEREDLNQPEHHNTILVDGRGPVDYLDASIAWGANLAGRPPADGHASLVDPLDTEFLDAVRVVSRYGNPSARIERRFLFPDHAYLVATDRVTDDEGAQRDLTWLLHGNAGGDTGAAFTEMPWGGRWERGDARLDGIFAAPGPHALTIAESVHEELGKQRRTHATLQATLDVSDACALLVAYPSRSGESAPIIERSEENGAAEIRIEHPAANRRVRIRGCASPGGATALLETDLEGRLRLAFAERTTILAHDGNDLLRSARAGRIGLRRLDDRIDIVADTPDDSVWVHPGDLAVGRVDGACGWEAEGEGIRVLLSRERRFSIHRQAGNQRPAADPGPDRRVATNQVVALDGTASCDANGDSLSARWELVSAPAGSAWRLEGPGTLTPELHVDRTGPYRIRLVVTDEHGAESAPAERRIVAGAPCGDGMDSDLDGWFDTDDPGCRDANGASEAPECADGIDNDGDDATDTADPQCTVPWWTDESALGPHVGCAGDCDSNGAVTIDELLRGVRMALGALELGDCAAFDRDRNGAVAIDELVEAVGLALSGCNG